MKLLCLLIVIFAAIFLGFSIVQNPGYALFVYKNWMIQMPLWLVLFLSLLLFFVLHLLVRSLRGLFSIKHSAVAWWRWHHYRQTSRDIRKRVTKYAHIQQLIISGQQEEAEKKLRKILKHRLDDEALSLYQSISILAEKRYKYALRWQKQKPQHAALLALLGSLAAQLKLWGLAKKYYAESLELSFVPIVSLHYADFLLAQQEKDLAIIYYRKGLSLAAS